MADPLQRPAPDAPESTVLAAALFSHAAPPLPVAAPTAGRPRTPTEDQAGHNAGMQLARKDTTAGTEQGSENRGEPERHVHMAKQACRMRGGLQAHCDWLLRVALSSQLQNLQLTAPWTSPLDPPQRKKKK
jgi:hypothetical protein